MGGDGGVIAANRKFLRQCGDAFLTEQQKLAQGVDQRERQQLRSQVQCIVDAPVALTINKPLPFSPCSKQALLLQHRHALTSLCAGVYLPTGLCSE
jgi:hypothetical protein